MSTTTSKIYFESPTGARVGTDTYFAEAMAAKFYGVENDGRAYRVDSNAPRVHTFAEFEAYVTSENEGDDVSAEIARAREIVGADSALDYEWMDAFAHACDELETA